MAVWTRPLSAARIEEHVRTHELVPAGRRRPLPRLRRRRLDLSLARARRARLPRRRAAREPRAARARSPRRTPRSAPSGSAPSRRGARRAPRPSCATCATRSSPAGCGRPATPPPTRSRRSSIRLVSSGTTTGIRVRRDDGVVRPLLTVWRDETEAYCRAEGLEFRVDSSNADTQPRAHPRRDRSRSCGSLHPAAERNILALARAAGRAGRAGRARARRPRRLAGGLEARRPRGRRRGRARVRPGLARAGAGRASTATVRWGGWVLASQRPGLRVRGWRAGDRLAGRRKKVQDLFVDAKVPRSKREAWPLVVRGDDVVTVPGIASAPGWEDAVSARRDA